LFTFLFVGLIVVTGISLISFSGCGSDSDESSSAIPDTCFSTPISPPNAIPGSDPEGFFRFTSSIQVPDAGIVIHVHDLFIEESLLESVPPNCLSFLTSFHIEHDHIVDFTVEQLEPIINGEEITVETARNFGHSHVIPVQLPSQ